VADLQSKAGIENREYKAQRSVLADVDAGKISREELFARAEELMKERMMAGGISPASPSHGSRPAATAPAVAAVSAPKPPVVPPAIDGGFVAT
jgi:hypothetical protein